MIEPGDILLVRGNSFWERIIEWGTSSPYSHAAMQIPWQHGCELIESKEFRGIRVVPRYLYARADWFRVGCTEKQRKRAWAAALSRLGDPYGWAEVAHDWNRPLAGLALAKRTHLRAVDCSMLVVWAYRQAGVNLTNRPYPTPADLAWSPLLTPLASTPSST